MKKILMLCVGLALSTGIYSRVYYSKTLGFFNHYKLVTQTVFNNGDIFMECHEPGWTRCRPQSLYVITFDGISTTIQNEELNAIDETVTRSAIGGSNSGRFVYGEKFFVTFTYNEETDQLSTAIYTLPEAAYYNLL